MAVRAYYYRMNEARLKPSATLIATKYPAAERMSQFWRFITDSFDRETPEYKEQIKADNEAHYQVLLEGWKKRTEWDGTPDAMNRSVLALCVHRDSKLM
jgi:hypothetical protein